MSKDRKKNRNVNYFPICTSEFFFPRSFDTFHLNKNRNHIRASYRMKGLWNNNNKKSSSVCSFWKPQCLCSQEVLSQWSQLWGGFAGVLWWIPVFSTPYPRALGLCSWFMKRSTHNHSWLKLNCVFMAQKQKDLIYIREMQESFCQSKLHEMAAMLYHCTKQGQKNKVDESDPTYLN